MVVYGSGVAGLRVSADTLVRNGLSILGFDLEQYVQHETRARAQQHSFVMINVSLTCDHKHRLVQTKAQEVSGYANQTSQALKQDKAKVLLAQEPFANYEVAVDRAEKNFQGRTVVLTFDH